MDEVNSSSSSSIGKEENANQAFNDTNKLKKSIFINAWSSIVVGKLNFTGKPFAPDSIFINNIGKNLGDEDEGEEFDHISDLTAGVSSQEQIVNIIIKICRALQIRIVIRLLRKHISLMQSHILLRTITQ